MSDPELIANLARTRVRESDLEMALEMAARECAALRGAIGCAIEIIRDDPELAKDQRFVVLREIFDKAMNDAS